MLSPDDDALTPAEHVSIAERLADRYVTCCGTHQKLWERCQDGTAPAGLRHKAGEFRQRMELAYAELTVRLEHLHWLGLGDTALEIHRRALLRADAAMVAATHSAIAAEMSGAAS